MSLLPRELHRADRLSTTAGWTALIRARELDRPEPDRIVTDRYALPFLPMRDRAALRLSRLAAPAVTLAERSELGALATSVLCRHRFLDEQLLVALPDVTQVVILGAGYDTRAYRFRRSIGGRPVFEVDLPPMSRHKARVVAAHRDLFGTPPVVRVEIDFRTQSLAETLVAAGFVPGAPTFVAWEGVAMYLTPDAVAGTLSTLGELCGSGSVVGLDMWRRLRGLRPYDQLRRVGERAFRLIGEPITYAASPEDVAGVLDDAGFTVADLATADELTRRHARGGRHCDEGLYLLAGRRR